MMIILSNKAKGYIKKKCIKNLLIKISFFTEGCVHVYEPKIETIIPENIKNYLKNDNFDINGIHVYLSNQYNEIYKNQKDIHVDLQKFPRKKLIIKNIDPIIINACKLEE